MAPVAVNEHKIDLKINPANVDFHVKKGDSYKDDKGVVKLSKQQQDLSPYPDWLPTWNPNEKFGKLQPFKFVDPGFRGDPNYLNLFPLGGLDAVAHSHLSPKLGTEILDDSIQLSRLTGAQKDDLLLLVERRGVVVFRNQDLKDKGLQFNKEFGQHFGPLHIHPTSGAPQDYPEFHITYRKSNEAALKQLLLNTRTTTLWHSDVTYELQPPGITFFTQLQGPSTGGDTLFADCIEAYERLSDTMKGMIDNLKVIHTSKEQATDSTKRGGIERRPTVDSIHPLVRYHPVLKKKGLFLHKVFLKRIVGLKNEENEFLLKFLIEHIENTQDLQIRARYEPGTVVIWDNRRVLHSLCLDWTEDGVRHCYRITPQGERPVGSLEEFENWSVEKEYLNSARDEEIVDQYY